jgi:hypothetical protein
MCPESMFPGDTGDRTDQKTPYSGQKVGFYREDLVSLQANRTPEPLKSTPLPTPKKAGSLTGEQPAA